MAKYFPITTILLILLVSCSSKPKAGGNGNESEIEKFSSTPHHLDCYENEYYSIFYPSDWTASEEIRDKHEGFEKYEGDEKVTYKQHCVHLLNDHGLIFNIVMSNLHFDLPVEDYADLSVSLKGIIDAGEIQDTVKMWMEEEPFRYLSLVCKDTVTLSDQKAIRLIFALEDDSNNYYLHHQFVIKNHKNDVFYVNFTCEYADTLAAKLGDMISSTFTLKNDTIHHNLLLD